MKTQIQLKFILFTVTVVLSETDYCNLSSCPNASHTLCTYPDAGPAKDCKPTLPFNLGAEEIDTILFMHNNLELLPTTHKLRTFSFSGSSDLRTPLEWDNELAEIAQRWADQCEKGIDECRNVERFNVSQRVGIEKTFAHQSSFMIEPIIRRWHTQTQSDLASLDSMSFENLSLEEPALVHETYQNALILGNITHIGCGAITKIEKLLIKLVLVCNYGPT